MNMEELKRKCEEKSETEPVYGKIRQLFAVEDHKEYLKNTREVIQDIKCKDELKNCNIILQCLAELFFTKTIDTKGSVRRLIASFFNNLNSDSKTFLSVIFQGCILSKTSSRTDDEISSNVIRQNVDILANLLENFPFGETCVIAAVVPYTNYLADSHQHFLSKTESATSPVLLNLSMHHCLVTEQLVNRMIQKCFSSLQEKLSVNSEDVEGVLLKLVVTNVKILLKMDDILMDCRCNAAITLTLVSRLCCSDNMGPLFVSILRNSNIPESVPMWLKTALECVKKSKLSTPSYLCFLFGSLSMLTLTDLMFEYRPDSFLLTEVFLPEILQLVQLVSNPASKVILSKLINLWTEKAWNLSKDQELPHGLQARFRGGSVLIQNILEYIWNSVDDSLDAVRQNARIAFDQLLKTHLLLSKGSNIDEDPWISKLIKEVLDIPWCKRGKYPPLSCLVGNLGASRILQQCPTITNHVICQLADHTLACYCSEFYEKLYTSHKLELPTEQSSEWFKIWVNPVIEGLCLNCKSTKNHILQYLLPKLMSFSNDILQYMIEYLSNCDSQSQGTLGALIMCLRRGRSLGLLDDQKSDETMWCGVVHVDVLKYALCSLDEQIRLDAFSLMCENKKTSKPIKSLEFELVKLFIPNNLNNQSPSFRQHTTAYTKKFFIRINDSQSTMVRNMDKSRKSEEKDQLLNELSKYRSFLMWLQNYLFQCLYPGAAFAMRTSCLKLLRCLMEVLYPPASDHTFDFFVDLSSSHLVTLLECIADTFEDNKMEALKIFSHYVRFSTSPVIDQLQLKELFNTCVQLSVSTRPQDSTASAYLARCLLQINGIEDVMSGYSLDLKVLQNQTKNGMNSPEPHSNYLQFTSLLLLSLQDQTEFAKKGLVLAAANRPIYPTIHCMRYILGDINLKSCSKSSLWKEHFGNLVKVCLDVAEIVSPVVQDSSPEGNVPAEAIRGPGLNFDAIAQTDEDKNLMLEAEKSEKTVTLMPEYLVVCCWRSIKEVSLLLGEICLRVSIENEIVDEQGLLSFDQIQDIGEYYITQLLQSKHRGAFELAYAGFVMLTERLWKSPLDKLNQLPLVWLDKLLEDIAKDDGTTGLCSTRRSAGIPFYVQALLGTEPEVNEHKAFQKAMTILLKLSMNESSPCTTNNPPRVHSLNILKVLFKDNKLGDFVSPYISDGLIAAILGFKSKFWSVRNSSTLLLSSLMTRIFGVKVSKDDSDLSRKNCLTGRAFFQKFPKLYDFLLSEFKSATENLSSVDGIHLHPSLYPVLMVLGRLYPSAMEGTDTNLNLAAFVPLVIKCSSSPVFKTRVMAARAIQPLVEKDRVTSVLLDLIQLLPRADDPKTYSCVHGVLTQIRFLLDAAHELSLSIKASVLAHVSPVLEEVIWLLSEENRCPMVLEIAFEVFYRTFTLIPEASKVSLLYPKYVEYLQKAATRSLIRLPGGANCQAVLAKLALKYQDNDSSVVVGLLRSDCYEVRLSVLNQLLEDINKVQDVDHVPNELLKLALHNEWHFECLGKAFEVLATIPNLVDCIKEGVVPDVFTTCLKKLETERRDEVKCSLIRFISLLVGSLYNCDNVQQNEHLLIQWYKVLKEHSSTEQDADLQLAVAQSLLDNTDIALRDHKGTLNELTMDFWIILFDLLQEDDLDVKEVTSKVYLKLDASSPGEVQPGHALNLLLHKMVEIHFPMRPSDVFQALLKLLQGEEEEEFEDERLFDKGEMNTYRDELHFVQLVARCLSQTIKNCTESINLDVKSLSIFDNTAKTLTQRLKKCSALSISASFQDSSSYSRTVTEICRTLLFLQCCDKLSSNFFAIDELRAQVKTILDKSSVNYCVKSFMSTNE